MNFFKWSKNKLKDESGFVISAFVAGATIIGGIAAGVTFATFGIGIITGALVVGGIAMVGQAMYDVFTMEMPGMPEIADSSTYRADQPTTTIKEDIPAARCYGWCQISGNIVRTSDPNDEKLKLIINHCSGEIDEILSWKFNNIEYDDLKSAGSNWKDYEKGTFTQGIMQKGGSDFFGLRDCAYRGKAYTAVELKKDSQIGGTPSCLISGRFLKCSPIAKSIVGPGYNWTLGSGGTNEYFCTFTGIDPIGGADSVLVIDGTVAIKGTPGALDIGEWGWSGTFIYVRLLDETDPDTKPDDYIFLEEPKAFSRNSAVVMWDFYRNVENYPMAELNVNDFKSLETLSATYPEGEGFPCRSLGQTQYTVKATTEQPIFLAHLATSPFGALTGAARAAQWISAENEATGQCFNIDLAIEGILTKIILINGHIDGGSLTMGINNFIIQGSNSSTAFDNTTYADDTGWTTISDALVATQYDSTCPEKEYAANVFTTAYRYFRLKVADNHGANEMGIRDISFYIRSPRYTFDFNFDNRININDAKKLIWRSFNGVCIRSQGKIKPIWKWNQIADGSGGLTTKTSKHSFTVDNIVKGSLTWWKPDRPNVLTVSYLDSHRKFVKTSIRERDDSDIDERGEIPFEETCWFLTHEDGARRRVKQRLNEAIYVDYKCRLSGFSDSSDLEALDLVDVTHTLPGWTGKEFIVLDKTEDEYGHPVFILEAYFSGIYGDQEGGVPTSYFSRYQDPMAIPIHCIAGNVVATLVAPGTGYDFDSVKVSITPPIEDSFYSHTEIYASNDNITYYQVGTSSGEDHTIQGNGMIYEPGDTCYIKTINVSQAGVKEDMPSTADASVVTTGAIKLANFYAGLNDFWGGNAAIGNIATTIVLGNLDGTPKIALGPMADAIVVAGTAPGFIADGTGKVYFGDGANKYFKFDGTNINWKGINTELTAGGAFTATSATITGVVTANTGKIGGANGWVISAGYLKDVAGVVGLSAVVTGGDDVRFWAGHATPGSAPFRVTEAGVLVATNATISGAITAGTIDIGGDDATSFHVDANGGIWSGASIANKAAAPFRVSNVGAIVCTSATITGALTTGAGSAIDGQYLGALTIQTASIANLAITATQIANNTITSTQIAALTITAAEIANATITGTQIASATVTSDNITNLTIVAGDIANTTITATQIANATITTAQISGTAAITGGQIASATITSGNITDATIIGTDIASATISGGNIGSATITGSNIAATTVMAGNIANATITTTQISATAGITGGQIDGLTITAGNIANLTITAAQIANLTITAAQIATDTIVASKLKLGVQNWSHDIVFSSTDMNTVTWASGIITMADGATYSILTGNTDNMTVRTYIYLDIAVSITVLQTTTTAGTAVGDSKVLIAVAQNSTTEAIFQVFSGTGGIGITGGDIENNSILAAQIAANTITANEIAANTITASEIVASTITTTEIAADTIAAGNIAANAITGSELAADSVTSTHIVADTIVASDIATNTITANEIAANTITASEIAAATITATEISAGSITLVKCATETTNQMFSSATNRTNIEAWKHASDVTKIDGGDIYTSTVTANQIDVGNYIGFPSDEHLVGYWAFDDGSGTVAVDGSGNGNNGTLVNMEEADWVDGVVGKCLDFDGGNDYVNCGANVPNDLTGNITFVCWIKPDTMGEGGCGTVISNGKFVLELYAGNSGFIFKSDGSTWTYSRSNAITLSAWQCIVIVREADGTVNLYVNGEHTGNTDQNSGTPAAGTINTLIGCLTTTGSNAFDGLIDEVRVYDTVLTASEIKALYLYPAGNKGTRISGNQITTGVIQSTNWAGGTGMQIDLDNNTITVKQADGLQVDSASGIKVLSGGDITVDAGGDLFLTADNSDPAQIIIKGSAGYDVVYTSNIYAVTQLLWETRGQGSYQIATPNTIDISSQNWSRIKSSQSNQAYQTYLKTNSAVSGNTVYFKGFVQSGMDEYVSLIGYKSDTEKYFAFSSYSVGVSDLLIKLQIDNIDKFTLGVDDSDSDKFKIHSGGSLVDSSLFTMDSSGLVTLSNNLLVNSGDIGITADTDLIQLAANALTVNGTIDINTINAGTSDYDKFLVSDSGIIKYRTGAQVLSDIGAAPAGDSIIKAWINFNGTGTIAINDSFNVASITDNGIGDYTITWDTDFANVGYSWVGSTIYASYVGLRSPFNTYQLTGSIQIRVINNAGNLVDQEFISIQAIGDQ